MAYRFLPDILPLKRSELLAAAIVLTVCLSVAAVASTTADHEAAFLAQNEAAMRKMMTEMAIKPSGNIDRDFVDMMVPHHEGAIDMATAYLRFGHNATLRRVARGIIDSQRKQVTTMRLAVGEAPPGA